VTNIELELFIREIVNDELHGDRKPGKLAVWGAQSKKRIGELVGDALMHTKVVVIDGRGITTISGHKPLWK
jgi:phosphatidylserine/phosphatidylglycerophosphate/cardiolipin synthase-like enzyme